MKISRSTALRLGAGLALAAVIGVLYLTPARDYMTFENARRIVTILRGLWYGPIVFILLYGVLSVFAVPASLFILSAGVIWGWWPGALYALFGGLIGAMLTLWTGHYLGKGLLPRLGRTGAKLEKQLESADFTTILFIRLIPLFPFPVINYAAGIAGVRSVEFFFATLIALTPGTFIVAYSADAIVNGTLSPGDALVRIAIACALLMLLVLLPKLVKWLFRGKVSRELEMEVSQASDAGEPNA